MLWGKYYDYTIRLVFFECCKDGHWGRFWNLWIYTGLPFVGAFISLTLIRILYKDCYEKQIKAGLKLWMIIN